MAKSQQLSERREDNYSEKREENGKEGWKEAGKQGKEQWERWGQAERKRGKKLVLILIIKSRKLDYKTEISKA